MKAFRTALLLTGLAAASCAKSDDVAILRHEATALAKYYTPKLDSLDQRVQAIFKRGATIPATLPGIEAVGQRLTEARDTLLQLRAGVGPSSDGTSAFMKDVQKTSTVDGLSRLIHEKERELERGVTVIKDNLAAVESWIAQYERQATAQPIEPVAPPQPPIVSPSVAGQPPGTVQPAPGGGQPAPGGAQPAPGGAQPAPGGARPAPGGSPSAPAR